MVEYWDGTGVTPQPLKAEVIRLATESPDTVKACIYSEYDGTPVCIVGQAVFNITGKVVDNYTWFGQLSGSYLWLEALGGYSGGSRVDGWSGEDYKAFRFVADVQDHQDAGNTWGEALKHAQDR